MNGPAPGKESSIAGFATGDSDGALAVIAQEAAGARRSLYFIVFLGDPKRSLMCREPGFFLRYGKSFLAVITPAYCLDP